ncbi:MULTISPECIES: hypothetical protein [unclassified Desulfovibrio]|uniref:hypothetical protein n=1 Tax=unclassified Desulfovibrio TaxID=2593640 RepID=UPI0013EE2C19|nr:MULTISPECIES: hypothetical protein [unclassified Desulfovibrio]
MSLIPNAPSPSGNATSLAALKAATKDLPPDTPMSFFSAGGFTLMQRAATMLSRSTLVPPQYREEYEKKDSRGGKEMVKNPNALSNCVLALNMAQRIGADPLMIMQNLYIVEGRPGWSSQFIIAAINACGKFSPLRFTCEDNGEKQITWKTQEWSGPQGNRQRKEVEHKAIIRAKSCTAWAIEKATGEKLTGPEITMEMAVAEGWYGKNGSKWQTMPDVMLRYRAASFFGRLYAPELFMGLQTAEEVRDATITLEPTEHGGFTMELDELRAPLGEAATVAETPAEVEAPTEAVKASPEQRAEPEAAPKQAGNDTPHQQAQQAALSATPTPEAAPTPQAPQEMPTFQCPRPNKDGSTRIVDESVCMNCKDRPGCPEWDGGF